MEPTKLDRLFALKAVEKRAGEERKLLECECRDELLEAYRADGTDRRASPFFGPEAGKFSVKRVKAKPASEAVGYSVSDEGALDAWLAANAGSAVAYVRAHAAEFARAHFEGTGELPDGIGRDVYASEGEPERVTAQLYGFKPDVVLAKLAEGGGFLERANRLLLGGGE